MDSGNLVLHELYSGRSIKRMLWQSFDYPTDTLLPGMKLGINLQTGHQWFLRSWLTNDSPAEGSFTFGMDPNLTSMLIIKWLGEVQWTIGEFNWSVVSDYKFGYTSNELEKYYSYSVEDDVTSFPTLQIDQYGSLNGDNGFSMLCSKEGGYCGPYKNRTMCNRGSSYFEVKYGLMSSVDGTKFRESDNMTLYDCRLKCYHNCSCVAYAATNRENETGCEIWSRGTKFIKSHTDDSRNIYLEVQPKEIKWRIIAIVGALVVILLCSLSYVARRKYKKRLLQGQQLKDGDELLSAFGKFNLRFFSPKDLTNRYLGVWFDRPKDVMLTLYEEDYYEQVWVATGTAQSQTILDVLQ
ncbi:hypothetical protein EZV62_004016 [Acer yangbiense]|uniref:Apple domain-containing protein n=1 Tax=Acer yangbiense TaxID=1000413 RepID=A0A5C7IIW1_9ROSI|nr:hypothetical protein EZV62_004016 [Acer yangbiense]